MRVVQNILSVYDVTENNLVGFNFRFAVESILIAYATQKMDGNLHLSYLIPKAAAAAWYHVQRSRRCAG